VSEVQRQMGIQKSRFALQGKDVECRKEEREMHRTERRDRDYSNEFSLDEKKRRKKTSWGKKGKVPCDHGQEDLKI